MHGAAGVLMVDTKANNLVNLGPQGTSLCGAYTKSHPAATLEGYGGAAVRAYTFAGSTDVQLRHASAESLSSLGGSISGCEILTDSDSIRIRNCEVLDVDAGLAFVDEAGSPNEVPGASGVRIREDVGADVQLGNVRLQGADAPGEVQTILDERP